MPGLSLVCLLVLAQTPPPVQRPGLVVGGVQTGRGAPPGPAGQSRDQIQRMPLVGKGSLSGVVLNENGRPVKGARVSLSGGAVGRTEISGTSGEFLFDKLPEGRYSINVNRQRYLSSSYGQKRPERTGTSIQLADAEIKKDLSITLFAGAAITGIVFGDDGEPVQNAQVRAMKYSMRTGVRRLQMANGVQTDDRGVYRIFGLTPGEYVISASSNNQEFSSQMNPEMTLVLQTPAPVTFAPTYYPGATSPAGALTVTIAGGEERQGIDISLMKVQTSTITGMVVSATGTMPQNITVSLAPFDEAAQNIGLSSARVTPDGRFTLRTVPPGQYYVVARGTSSTRLETPATPNAMAALQNVSTLQQVSSGRSLVSVDGSLVSNVVITLDGGRTISGRVLFEGGMLPDLTRTRMTASVSMELTATTGTMPAPQPGQVLLDGSFKITNVPPGRYRLRVSGAQNYSLKSSIVRGRDSLDYAFDVENEDVTDAVVTLAFGLAQTELSGTITDQQSHPAVDYTIVVFSSDQRFWTPGSRRISTARPGTDGRFTVRGLPAGDYQIAALGDLEPGMQYELEFLRALLPASTRVTLGEGAKVNQDLRITVATAGGPWAIWQSGNLAMFDRARGRSPMDVAIADGPSANYDIHHPLPIARSHMARLPDSHIADGSPLLLGP